MRWYTSCLCRSMARLRRSEIIFDGCLTHKTWHSHHKDFNLKQIKDKEEYLRLLFQKIKPEACDIHSFSLMSNHAHEGYEIRSVRLFSEFMRIHHTLYGQYFNKKYNRKGKVANDRPYTKLIKDDRHEIISTLYIHANPIKDGLVNDAKDFDWSTHLLYGYGKDYFSEGKIVFPRWYIELGSTTGSRKMNYLNLFDQYVEDYILNRASEKCASPL